MICDKCKTENLYGQNFCTNCGAPLNTPPAIPKEKPTINQAVQNLNDNTKANILCLCSIGVLIFDEFITNMGWGRDETHSYTIFLILVAVALMIIVRVKYPKNTFGKILMWLYIVLGIIFLAFMIVSIAACITLFGMCIS